MKILKELNNFQSNSGTFCQNSGTSCLNQKETPRPTSVCQNNIPEKWRVYSHADLESTYNFSKTTELKKYRFFIDGLRCSSCVRVLEEFPNYCKSVTNARINFSENTLNIECANDLDLGELCYLIEQLGYKPTPIKEESDIEQARIKDVRGDLMRIGVAGAIAGNEMLFSTPIYAGLIGALGLVFQWISFFIFLPLLFYVAVPFYQRAWASLKLRRVNVDMMIVAALWAGFIFSTVSLIQQTDEVYFDSTASFIFLILLTRYLLKRQQDRLISKNLFADLFANEIYEVISQETTSHFRFDHIQKNQIYRIKSGQLVPCDSVLKSAAVEFDLSFLTGEPFPGVRHQGNVILAGSRLLSPHADLKCETPALSSQLAASLNRLDQVRTKKNKIQTLSDFVSHRLTVAVFSVAGLFFMFTFNELGIEAFKRCLALITIACPCAVAFGTPLAHTLGLRKVAQNGFFIKSEDIFERLSNIKKIIFDKTGTLTSANLDLVLTTPSEISDKTRSLILGLEKSSMHPVALSLKKKWSTLPVFEFPTVHETAGLGVEAYFNSQFYEFKKSTHPEKTGALKVDFFIDSELICSVFFNEKIRPESSEVVRQFKADGFSVLMLTGDRRSQAIQMARQTEINELDVFADQSSVSKKRVIQKQNPCLYVGDGLNDLEALSAAYSSFAIKGTFESTLQISDVYAPQKNLRAIHELFVLSHQINKTVKWNLIFALVYNVIGGALALLGFINPLVAAVLMPVSSFLIFAHTTWRLK